VRRHGEAGDVVLLGTVEAAGVTRGGPKGERPGSDGRAALQMERPNLAYSTETVTAD
jgi:hypothetical protein